MVGQITSQVLKRKKPIWFKSKKSDFFDTQNYCVEYEMKIEKFQFELFCGTVERAHFILGTKKGKKHQPLK
jgi:hypothetical protein